MIISFKLIAAAVVLGICGVSTSGVMAQQPTPPTLRVIRYEGDITMILAAAAQRLRRDGWIRARHPTLPSRWSIFAGCNCNGRYECDRSVVEKVPVAADRWVCRRLAISRKQSVTRDENR